MAPERPAIDIAPTVAEVNGILLTTQGKGRARASARTAADALTTCATCDTIEHMRTAGVRRARQDLSSLLDDVRKGREVTITDRGRPVARLVPVGPRQPFPDLKKLRQKMRPIDPPLSRAILEEREDRS